MRPTRRAEPTSMPTSPDACPWDASPNPTMSPARSRSLPTSARADLSTDTHSPSTAAGPQMEAGNRSDSAIVKDMRVPKEHSQISAPQACAAGREVPPKARVAGCAVLPHAAGVHRRHGLAGLAAEGLAHLWHVLHHAVDAELARRVRIGLHLQANLCGTDAAAPVLSEGDEEFLNWRIAVRVLRLEVDVLALRVCQEGHVGEAQAAVVGRVLAQRELAVHLNVVHGGEVAVLLHLAIGLLVELLSVIGSPPIGQVSIAVKLASLIVEAVRELVADDSSGVTIILSVRRVRIEEQQLQNASWKIDIVHAGVVVGVDRRRSHAPLAAIDWL